MKKVLAIILAAVIGLSLSAQPKRLTVKEFLKVSPKDTASYIVSGVVSKIRSASSGSFYLKDRTGTMLVYGIMDPKEPKASFSMLNIMKGDTLTVQGRFLLYAGQTKEMKDALLLSLADGPEHGKTFLERLDRQPSFQGKEGQEGAQAFGKWVSDRVQRPAGEKGTVVVGYAIGRKGNIQEVQVLSGASPVLNDEVVRVVKSAPKWKPAKYDGNPIRLTGKVKIVFTGE